MSTDSSKNSWKRQSLADNLQRLIKFSARNQLDVSMTIQFERAGGAARRQLESQIVQDTSFNASATESALGWINANIIR
jgi:hypothetical protein